MRPKTVLLLCLAYAAMSVALFAGSLAHGMQSSIAAAISLLLPPVLVAAAQAVDRKQMKGKEVIASVVLFAIVWLLAWSLGGFDILDPTKWGHTPLANP